MIDANGTSPGLRSELILESEMFFSQRLLSAGQQTFADGMSVPIEGSEDLLIIQAIFGHLGFAMFCSASRLEAIALRLEEMVENV